MSQKRTAHNKEIGYNGHRYRFLLDQDRGSRKGERLVRVVYRREHAIPRDEKEFVIHANLLPAFRSHLDRIASEMERLDRKEKETEV